MIDRRQLDQYPDHDRLDKKAAQAKVASVAFTPKETKLSFSQLFDKHVSHVRMRKNNCVEFHVRDEKSAQQIISQHAALRERACHHQAPQQKCYVISLTPSFVDILWGDGSYEKLRQVNLLHERYDYDALAKHLTEPTERNVDFLQQIFRLRSNNGGHWPLLMTAMKYFSSDICNKLIDEATDDTLNHAVLLQSNHRWSTLIVALKHRSLKICLKLIDRMTDHTLNHALLLQNDEGWSGLQIALRSQSPEICIRLINRMTDAALNHALLLQNQERWSGLITALRFQSPEVCARLAERMTENAVNQVLILQPENTWSTIMMAAYHQSGTVFSTLVRKSSPATLAKASCILHPDISDSTFEIVAQYQPADAFKLFLQRLNDREAKIAINQFFKQNPSNLLNTFKRAALYQPLENTEIFLSLLDGEQQQALLHNYSRQNMERTSVRFPLRALQWKLKQQKSKFLKQDDAKETKKSLFFDHSIYAPNFIPEIKDDFRATSQKRIFELIAFLQKYDQTHPCREQKSYPETKEEIQALNMFNLGPFVKIVQDENNPEFIKHLFNPENRQAIRDKKDKRGYKILLGPKKKKTDEKKAEVIYSAPSGFPTIIKAHSIEERKLHKTQKPKHTNTTKHPVSFVSPEKHTALFGHTSRIDREMVGYAFTNKAFIDENQIKLLSLQDCGTFLRWWYSEDPNDLYSMVAKTQHSICSNFTEFAERVSQQPYVVNEALAKLNQQDLFAIIIAKDTPEARKIAIERQFYLQAHYKKDLPILFYDPEHQQSSVYTRIEQRQDYPELFLRELERTIQPQYQEPNRWAFFKKLAPSVRFRLDEQDYFIDAKKAKTILAIIKANKNTPDKTLKTITATLKPVAAAAPRSISELKN